MRYFDTHRGKRRTWILFFGFLLVALFAQASFAQAIGPHPPSGKHLLGTDYFDRDVLLWTISGAAYTLFQVLRGFLGAIIIGIVLGCFSALTYGKIPDSILVGIAEGLRSFPSVLLVLVFVVLGASPAWTLTGIYWLAFWRVLRVQLYQDINKGVFIAALSLGLDRSRSLAKHVLPHVLKKNITLFVSVFAEMISAECALEFLGLGPPLDVPSLGRQAFLALDYAFAYAWTWLPALVAIVFFIASLQVFIFRVLKRNKGKAIT